jgi:hypothetical protein
MAGPECVVVQPLSTYNWQTLFHTWTHQFNPVVFALLSYVISIALVLSIELIIQLHFIFSRFSLYYFSILGTLLGIAIHAICLGLQLFIINQPKLVASILPKIGCIMNVVGFSMVLYSRLNLVMRKGLRLKMILATIVTTGVLIYVPTLALLSLIASSSSGQRWIPALNILSRIEVLYYTLQELALNTIYTYTTAELLKDRYTPERRNLFIALLFTQVLAFVIDVGMVVLICKDFYILKGNLHPALYAIKLKIEFAVLNRLSSFVQQTGNDFIGAGIGAPAGNSSAQRRRGNSMCSLEPRANREWHQQNAGGCERCQQSAGKAAASTVNDMAQSPDDSVNASLGIRDSVATAGADHDELALVENAELDGLERQYLGKFC